MEDCKKRKSEVVSEEVRVLCGSTNVHCGIFIVHVTTSQLAKPTEKRLRPQKYYVPYQTVRINSPGVDFAKGITSLQRNEQDHTDAS